MTRDELIEQQRGEIKGLVGKIAELERLAAAISADCNDMANERNQLRAELDALTAKLDASKFCANVADDLHAELAAIKAQEPVAWMLKNEKGRIEEILPYMPCASDMQPYWPEPLQLYAAPVAKQVVMPEPDMFWDAENPEDSYADEEPEMFNNLADNIGAGDGKVVIKLMRAARLPSIEAAVWVTEDSDGGRDVHWEYLNAADQEGDV